MSIALSALLVLGACNKDKVNYVDPTDQATDNIGYLMLGNMEASILEDTENVESAATRAEGVEINDFDVVVTNNAGEVMASFKYGERPTEPIVLESGVYAISMVSRQMEGAEWEQPVYAGKKEVIVTRKQTTNVTDLVCKLANIKVTVDYSVDLKEQLDSEYTSMTVAVNDSELVFVYGEERAAYFAPESEESTLKLTFKCRYKGETKDIVMTNEIKGVKPAQWRKINVVVQHVADGTGSIGIVCDTWTYDEEVTFDTSVAIMEEVIPDDTDAPEIVWEGHDLAEAFELTDEMFDAEGNFTKSINLDITAKSPIKSLVVKVASDNADFVKAYSEIMSVEEDLCAPATSNTILKMMGYPTDAKDNTAVRIKLASQTDLLKSYEGTHTYEITVTDTIGAKTTATLTVKYGQNVSPKIEWVGYDIDQRQTIKTGDTCMIRVTAPLAIQDFEIEIVSNALTPEELQGVGLAAEFSLVNSTEMFTSLSGLGFPVGDQVYNQTLISEDQLNISNFLGVLGMLGAGDHDFVMTVTDMEGNATTKTVMMRFE